jgi:hypothetical protein
VETGRPRSGRADHWNSVISGTRNTENEKNTP